MHHTYRRRGNRAEIVPSDDWHTFLARAELQVAEAYQTAQRLSMNVIDPSFPEDSATRHAEAQHNRGIGVGIVLALLLIAEHLLSGQTATNHVLKRLLPDQKEQDRLTA